MSKAILVVDMPNSCSKCDFCEHQDEGWLWCNRCKRTARAFDRPDWCPLKEMPQKDDSKYYLDDDAEAFVAGYNACIDSILEESEEE